MPERSAEATASCPIAPEDVDQVFDTKAIADLAQIAKLPPHADLEQFGDGIRVSVRNFLERRELNNSQLRAEIQTLYRYTRRADRVWGGGHSERAAQQLASAIDAMPDDVRRRLTMHTPPAPAIPAPEAFLKRETRQQAVQELRLLLMHGGAVVTGRKRPGGKQSLSFRPYLNVPAVKSSRPRDQAARELIRWLAFFCAETGKRVPNRVSDSSPFARFITQCLDMVGVPSGSTVRLINEYGKIRQAPSVSSFCTKQDH